jgi:hypothetical protein
MHGEGKAMTLELFRRIAGQTPPRPDVLLMVNDLFDELMRLDVELTRKALENPDDEVETIDARLEEWLEVSEGIRVAAEYEGKPCFDDRLRQARSMVTPDDEYFTDDKLFDLGERALESGDLEPLLDGEYAPS